MSVNGQKRITIPSSCEIMAGDYVEIFPLGMPVNGDIEVQVD